MKKYLYALLVVVFALSAAVVHADDLSNVQREGKLVVALAPDYVPFAYYGRDGILTGIDVELIREVGKRMGVNVDIVDYAFDGMVDALKVEQVDVIGTAFAITPERSQIIDFSRAYYSGDSKFVVRSSSQYGKAGSPADFAGMVIGVQKGTSFEQWVRTNLVDNNYIPAKNVYTYTLSSDAMKALEEGRVDTVLIDEESYLDIYDKTGNFKVFAEGFMKENYAFGVRKGSNLSGEISKHLTSMINDGTAQKIANNFFNMDYTGITSNSMRIERQTDPSIPTVVPVATSCTNAMAFVSDVSVPDGTPFTGGTYFTKTWRVKNTGSCEWTTDYTLVFTAGDHMNGQTIRVPKNVQPGQTVDLSVSMIAPNAKGNYGGYWQLRNQYGVNFGQTLWLKIKVDNTGQSGSGQKNAAVIKNYSADYYSGYPGTCTKIYWNVEKASGVDVIIDGRSFIQNASLQGSSTICDEIRSAGNHTIELIGRSSAGDARKTITFTTYNEQKPQEEDGQHRVIPSVNSFYLSSNSGNLGDCTTAYWSVSNASGIDITVDGSMITRTSDGSGSVTVCDEIQGEGMHYFELVAHTVTDDATASVAYTMIREEPIIIPDPVIPTEEPAPQQPEYQEPVAQPDYQDTDFEIPDLSEEDWEEILDLLEQIYPEENL